MTTITKLLAAGAALAGFAVAAPAAAQFFPGYPGYGYPGASMPGYGYPGYGYQGYGNGYNVPGGSRIAASQCRAAVQQRLGGYGGYGAYGYAGGYGPAVPRINSVELRPEGGYRVRGIVSTGGYAGGVTGFTCRTDPRGLVINIGFNNRYRGEDYDRDDYGNGYYGSDPNNPYAVYGYSRY